MHDNSVPIRLIDLKSKVEKWLLMPNRIKHERSAPYSLHQNETIEWSWRTLFSKARCLPVESKLPPNLWVYGLMVSASIRNCCYNKNTRKIQMKVLPVQNQT